MLRRLLSVFTVLLFLGVNPVSADPPVWFTSRTKLDTQYEPHRSFVVWRSTPGTYSSVTLTSNTLATVTCTLAELVGQQAYDRYHTLATIPDTAVSGTYTLVVNGTDTGTTITIVPRRSRARVSLTPSVVRKLETVPPYTDVTLAPGLYTLTRAVALQPGVRIYGYGAVIQTSAARTNGGSYEQLFFWPPADDLAFHGVTFQVANNVIYGSDVQWNNLHFNNCNFRPATHYYAGVGRFSGTDFLSTNCTYDRVAVTAIKGLFLDGMWKGLVLPRGEAHAFYADTPNSLCVARAKFDGVDRGPILGNNNGAVVGVLFTDLDLRNIGRVDNGNELILLEPANDNTYTQCVFHRGRVNHCEGDINLWTGRLSTSTFNDWIINDATICFYGFNPQTGNTVTNCEFRGGGLLFAGQATGNTVSACSFVDWRNTRRNQIQPADYLYSAAASRPEYRTFPVPNAPLFLEAVGNRPTKTGLVSHRLPTGVEIEGFFP